MSATGLPSRMLYVNSTSSPGCGGLLEEEEGRQERVKKETRAGRSTTKEGAEG